MNKIFLYIITLLVSMTTFFLVWSSNRGFDLTDEGWYLTSSQYPHENVTWFGSCFYFTGLLFNAVSANVAWFRLTGIFLLIGTGVFLGITIIRLLKTAGWISNLPDAVLSSAAFCSLGALMYYTWGLMTPSYNLLNAVCVNVFAGLAALLFNDKLQLTRKPGGSTGLVYLAGLVIALDFFVKFSTGIILMIIWLFWLWKLKMSRYFFVFFISLILFVLIYFISLQSFEEWLQSSVYGFHMGKHISHDVSHIAKRYLWNLKYFFAHRNILIIGALTGLAMAFQETSRGTIKKIYFLLANGLMAVLVFILLEKHFYFGGRRQILFIIQLYTAFLFLIGSYIAGLCSGGKNLSHHFGKGTLGSDFGCYVGILLLLPLAASVGTANPLTAQSLFTLAPLFAAIIVLLFFIRQLTSVAFFPSIVGSVMACFAVSQIVLAPILAPYVINSNILNQNVATTMGNPPSVIMLDGALSRFIGEIKAMAYQAGFRPGDDILAFYDMPGCVYALGGKSPATGWWWGPSLKGYRESAELNLGVLSKERVKRAYIMQSVSDELLPNLKHYGINFPQDYELAGEVYLSLRKQTVKLWKPLYNSRRLLRVDGH